MSELTNAVTEADDVLNEGVQMLIGRMESHPEEFGPFGKWSETVHSALENRGEFLSESEVHKLQSTLRKLRRDTFTADVMKQLMEEPEEDKKSPFMKTSTTTSTAIPGGYKLYGGAGGGGTSTWTSTSASNGIGHALAQQNALSQQRAHTVQDYYNAQAYYDSINEAAKQQQLAEMYKYKEERARQSYMQKLWNKLTP